MKRSEINAIMRDSNSFIQQHCFPLPPFAYWRPKQWSSKGEEVAEIVKRQLGWDITDFGSGDFERIGLFVFTIRNGDPKNLKLGTGKLYAEKILIVNVDQVTPMHFHWQKVEDIINRGCGKLEIQVYNSTADDQLDNTDVEVSLDGVKRVVPAGEILALHPGESITFITYRYRLLKYKGLGNASLLFSMYTLPRLLLEHHLLHPSYRTLIFKSFSGHSQYFFKNSADFF